MSSLFHLLNQYFLTITDAREKQLCPWASAAPGEDWAAGLHHQPLSSLAFVSTQKTTTTTEKTVIELQEWRRRKMSILLGTQ